MIAVGDIDNNPFLGVGISLDVGCMTGSGLLLLRVTVEVGARVGVFK
jgi:hypothetical protein